MHGRQYHDLKEVCCFECDVTAKQLQKKYQFLKWCSYVECRVFLCPGCRELHENMHSLAGDKEEVNVQRGVHAGFRRYSRP